MSARLQLERTQCFGPNCQFFDTSPSFECTRTISGVEHGAPITIGDTSGQGGGVTILPGATLGNNVVVGAGSVVTKLMVIMLF